MNFNPQRRFFLPDIATAADGRDLAATLDAGKLFFIPNTAFRCLPSASAAR
jgi:hypothetical protein